MKTVKISAAQVRVVVNALNGMGLLFRDESLPRAARELIRSTHKALRQVMHDTRITRDLPEDGLVKQKDGDHQWSTDLRDRWEALK